jgi:uncharacterized protein YjbI with pentapeptide repeats
MTGPEAIEIVKIAREKKEIPNLRGADLQNADLRGANLQYVDLQYANLQDADLRGANLRGADLQDAHLLCANLQGANLQDVDLQNAYLLYADLRRANLQEANLLGAEIDFIRITLSCSSLNWQIDRKLWIQFCYHLCSHKIEDAEIQEIRKTLLPLANQFHREDVPRLE